MPFTEAFPMSWLSPGLGPDLRKEHGGSWGSAGKGARGARTEHARPGLRVPTGLESGLESVPQMQRLPEEEVSPHPEGHQTAPTVALEAPLTPPLPAFLTVPLGAVTQPTVPPPPSLLQGAVIFCQTLIHPPEPCSRRPLAETPRPRPRTLVSAWLLPILHGPDSRCLSMDVSTLPCTRSSPAGMPGVHRLGSPGLAPVLARLASPVPGVWAAKEAIFSLCYPRNYLVSVLPWCSVHFCWKMLVCVSALRRNGDEGACPRGGRRPGGQRPSATSFCPLWEVLARGA